jgi:hypothetical protein
VVVAFDTVPDATTTKICIDDLCGEVATQRIVDAALTSVELKRVGGVDDLGAAGGSVTDPGFLTVGRGSIEATLRAGHRPSTVTVVSSWQGDVFTARAEVRPGIVGQEGCTKTLCYGAELTHDPETGALRQTGLVGSNP